MKVQPGLFRKKKEYMELVKSKIDETSKSGSQRFASSLMSIINDILKNTKDEKKTC